MPLKIIDTDIFVQDMQTRMPFRYGIATMTAAPHVFIRVVLDVDGTRTEGFAADHLPPKWFAKNPDTTLRHDVAQMMDVIEHAVNAARGSAAADSLFDWWRDLYQTQQAWAESKAYPALLWGFGVSLVERAAMDAFCRASGQTFAQALQSNAFGIDLGKVYRELEGVQPQSVLPTKPLNTMNIRHTVGLADPIGDADIPVDERLDDGLPQSLESCIDFYGITYFKIKVCGDLDVDVPRLKQIATLLGSTGRDYRYTLDGNEQFTDVATFKRMWEQLSADADLARFLKQLMFVEQPFHRDVALSDEVGRALRAWSDRPLMIIDESDGSPGDLPRALACGYNGTSHKNCKGVIKGIANACLLAHYRAQFPGQTFIQSAEDLANVGPVGLLQDLTVVASLGIDNAERNGHHYFLGLSMVPESIQSQVLVAHDDLYTRGESGVVRVNVIDGAVRIDSLVNAPFGLGYDLDVSVLTPRDQWAIESVEG